MAAGLAQARRSSTLPLSRLRWVSAAQPLKQRCCTERWPSLQACSFRAPQALRAASCASQAGRGLPPPSRAKSGLGRPLRLACRLAAQRCHMRSSRCSHSLDH